MRCPNCNSENLTCTTNITVNFPSQFFHKLTKKVIAKKEFKIYGVDWGDCEITCCDCGYTINLGDPPKVPMILVNPEDLIEKKEEGN